MEGGTSKKWSNEFRNGWPRLESFTGQRKKCFRCKTGQLRAVWLAHRFQEVSTAMDNQAAKLWNLRAGKVQTLQLYFEKNRRVAAWVGKREKTEAEITWRQWCSIRFERSGEGLVSDLFGLDMITLPMTNRCVLVLNLRLKFNWTKLKYTCRELPTSILFRNLSGDTKLGKKLSCQHLVRQALTYYNPRETRAQV